MEWIESENKDHFMVIEDDQLVVYKGKKVEGGSILPKETRLIANFSLSDYDIHSFASRFGMEDARRKRKVEREKKKKEDRQEG